MANKKEYQSRLAEWWLRRDTALRRVISGYSVVGIFAVTYLLAREIDPKLSLSEALVPAALVAAPLVIALLGDRITGLKFMSIEVSLAEVRVEINSDLSNTIQKHSTINTDERIEIGNRIVELIADPGRAVLLRVDLGDGQAWWSTRIFLLAALASDYTGIQRIVFVDEGAQQRFIGLSTPMSTRLALARRFPDYEIFYRKIRSDLATPALPEDASSEVRDVLQDWPIKFNWREEEEKEFVTRINLSEWLCDCLDSESIEWGGGPLTPLIRYQINSLPSQYVVMTSAGVFKAVVDRVALATRTERDLLRARLS